jgi:heme-degrading monooxygenase HmoA
MDGITITFELRLKPEVVSGFLEGFPHMIKETSEFPGFRSIRVVQHKDDPARVLLVEHWDSEDAYNKYIAWRAERGDFDTLGQVTNSTEVNVWPTLVVQI